MITVEFMGPIGKLPQQLDVKNLLELKEQLQKDESLKEWLGMCAVALNDTIVKNLDTKLQDGDKVTLLPPVCGG
jgi:molybdopterin synthase sulfur carrier subunit